MTNIDLKLKLPLIWEESASENWPSPVLRKYLHYTLEFVHSHNKYLLHGREC